MSQRYASACRSSTSSSARARPNPLLRGGGVERQRGTVIYERRKSVSIVEHCLSGNIYGTVVNQCSLCMAYDVNNQSAIFILDQTAERERKTDTLFPLHSSSLSQRIRVLLVLGSNPLPLG
jgi:hypothetical protein